MSIATALGYDCTGANIAHLPADPQAVALYVTGSGDVPATAADFAKYPHAVRIDQTPAHTTWDATADVQDFEAGAVQLAELAPRAKVRLAAFHAGVRPGQRSPVVYCSRANVTEVVNALTAGGVTSGVGLGIADWNGSQAEAEQEVADESGPFPVVWRQFQNNGAYDEGIFSVPWLQNVSVARPPVPPGQWNDPKAWTWAEAITLGTGLDGKFHMFRLNGSQWDKAL